MSWHTGLQRLRLVATVSLALGIVLFAIVLITNGLGYAPDPAFAQLFSALWPIGLALASLGALLWITVWVLHGFVTPAAQITAASPDAEAESRRGPLRP